MALPQTVQDAPAQPSAPSNNGMRAWLSVINATLAAVEHTVWQGRALAEQALHAWRQVEAGAGDMAEELQLLRDEAQRWPARLKRLGSTGWMLTRVTTSYRLWSIRSAFLPRSRVPAALEKLHRRNARAFRDISLQHGGAFLKIGQMLSARPDILPQVWVDELSTLQDRANCTDFQSVSAVIEADLKAPLDSLFSEFNPTPIAAASIGQVYRARLVDGREVAVKIQRPGLEDVIELDLALLRVFAESLRGVLPPTDFDTIVNEIQRSVREELDYRIEASWMQRIGNLLEPVEGVQVPGLISTLCSKHVLTSEFIVGQKLTDVLDDMKARGDEEGLAHLLGRLIDLYLRQILQAGYFQADPHPGNLLVTAEGGLVAVPPSCRSISGAATSIFCAPLSSVTPTPSAKRYSSWASKPAAANLTP